MKFLKKNYHAFCRAWFVINGRKPWSSGYSSYKEKQIRDVLARGEFNPEKLPKGYGFRIDDRIVEYPWLLSRLPSGSGKLLDAGSVLNFDFILAHKALENKRLFISTLSPEQVCYWKRGISYVYEDLRETCYRDNYFDWIVCLSTLEHIGMDNTKAYTKDASKKENDPEAHLSTIKEFHRTLKSGGTLYLSFPFGKYQNHGWFQVFNEKMVDRVISAFSPSSVIKNYFKYEPDGWRTSSQEESENVTFGMKRYIPEGEDYAAASLANICLEMVK